MNQLSHPKGDKDIYDAKWYVTRVHNMAFSRTRALLDMLNVDYFVPETFVVNNRRGRKVKELVPAIKDFFFIHASYEQIDNMIRLNKLPIAFYFSHTSHKQNDCLSVRDNEMNSFILASKAFDRMPEIQPYGKLTLNEGQRIKILSGIFEGVEGYYMQPRRGMKKQLVLNLSNLLTVNLRLSPSDLIEAFPAEGIKD